MRIENHFKSHLVIYNKLGTVFAAEYKFLENT